jgi:hypothetical protein
MHPSQVRDYLAGLKQANEFEVEELRAAPVELKLRQRWVRLYKAQIG